MPYPNFHAARIRNPKNFAWIKVLEKLSNGIMIYGGILKSDPEGKSKTQAYRFPKDKFSFAQAKDWLEKHKIKYISFEEAKEMQAFNVQLQCFILSDISQEEILKHIEPNILNKIKQKDAHPFFTAYSIAHEGESNPRILNDPSNKPIVWLKEAIQSIKNKIKKGIKFFKGHNNDNSTDNRESLGEVVGDFQKEINGNLNHIVIGYHPKDKVQEVKKRTICSQEAIWNLADQGVSYIAGALKELTGIALGKPEEEQPAFRGAQRLGMVQAFEINNPGRIKEINMAVTYEELLTVDVRLLQRVIEARAFWPNQLFGNDYDMSQDRIFGQIYREKEKLQTENEQLKTELKKSGEEIGVYKAEKEKATRTAHLQTVKTRFDTMIANLPGSLKTFIAKQFKPDKLTNLDDPALQSEIDRLSGEYKELAAAGIFKEEVPPKDKQDGIPADKDKTNTEIDYTLPENNPYIIKEESK